MEKLILTEYSKAFLQLFLLLEGQSAEKTMNYSPSVASETTYCCTTLKKKLKTDANIILSATKKIPHERIVHIKLHQRQNDSVFPTILL